MIGLALAAALVANVGGQIVLASNGNQISAIQWQGTATTTSVPNKTVACGPKGCLLYGVNTSVVPDGPIATGQVIGTLVASDPSGKAVPVQVIVPPATLTEVTK